MSYILRNDFYCFPIFFFFFLYFFIVESLLRKKTNQPKRTIKLKAHWKVYKSRMNKDTYHIVFSFLFNLFIEAKDEIQCKLTHTLLYFNKFEKLGLILLWHPSTLWSDLNIWNICRLFILAGNYLAPNILKQETAGFL